MHVKFSLVFFLFTQVIFAQVEPPALNNQTNLAEGIYTSVGEILANQPKYYNCTFDTETDIWFGQNAIYYTCTTDVKRELSDSALLIVRGGYKYVLYENQPFQLIEVGALSVFFIRKMISGNAGYEEMYMDMYFWDFMTGSKMKLTPENLEVLFQRDPELLNEFLELSRTKKKNSLFSYVVKFNARNPMVMGEIFSED